MPPTPRQTGRVYIRMCDLSPAQRHSSDDGTGVDAASQRLKDVAFAEWFHANGGSYPKLSWPSRETVGAVRGATAEGEGGLLLLLLLLLFFFFF